MSFKKSVSYLLESGGQTVIPAGSDFITDWFAVCFDHGWSLEPRYLGLDGQPTYTVEVANDQSYPKAYKDASTDVDIVDGIDDDEMKWNFIRVSYSSNANTTGTISFALQFKPE